MTVSNEPYHPKTRKQKLLYYGVLLSVFALVTGLVFTQMIIPGVNAINGRHLEYITSAVYSVNHYSVFITQATDHGGSHTLYGSYELANGVTLPDYIVKDGYGWAYITLSWGTITKIEPYHD